MMKRPPTKDLESYFAMSDSWAGDWSEGLRRSRRDAWRIAVAAVAVALLEGIALVLLIPLQKIVPYTLMVDRHTGYVELLKPLDPVTVSPDKALTQSFLAQYVIAREGYDIATIKGDYQKVALWSEGPAQQAYLAMMPATNPESPLVRYPRSTVLNIRIKSVTSLAKDRAMVRFDAIRQDRGSVAGDGQASDVQPQMAVIDYRYSGDPLSLEDRLINPLGFQVTRYRRSMEAAATPLAPSTALPPRLTVPARIIRAPIVPVPSAPATLGQRP